MSLTYPVRMNSPGWENMQTSFFLFRRPKQPPGSGASADLSIPHRQQFGIGNRWIIVGPNAALVYSEGPWSIHMLAYQLMSFAGNRERGSVNQTYIEPEISYNSESGWYVQCDPAITYDWTADTANGWTIPMGADIGKAFKMGSQDLSLQVGAYDLLKSPEGAPQWILRVSVTFLFPHVH